MYPSPGLVPSKGEHYLPVPTKHLFTVGLMYSSQTERCLPLYTLIPRLLRPYLCHTLFESPTYIPRLLLVIAVCGYDGAAVLGSHAAVCCECSPDKWRLQSRALNASLRLMKHQAQ